MPPHVRTRCAAHHGQDRAFVAAIIPAKPWRDSRRRKLGALQTKLYRRSKGRKKEQRTKRPAADLGGWIFVGPSAERPRDMAMRYIGRYYRKGLVTTSRGCGTMKTEGGATSLRQE